MIDCLFQFFVTLFQFQIWNQQKLIQKKIIKFFSFFFRVKKLILKNISGQCATLSANCAYTYTDFESNPSKYYFPNQAYQINTNSLSVGAKKRNNNNNNNKNSGGGGSGSSTTSSGNYGAIAGAVVGGVVGLIIIITLIVWWKKKQAALKLQQLSQINQTQQNQGTTIILTNNTPNPTYGINQPMDPYSQPMVVNQPVFQPAYSQPYVQPSFGMGIQPQQGPILY